MTVTVTYPPVNGKCGPGFFVYAQSSFVGPIGPQSFWNVRLYESTQVSVLCNLSAADAGKTCRGVLGVIRPTPGDAFATSWFFSIQSVDVRGLSGAAGKLVVELIDSSTGGVVDSVTQNVVIDLQEGVATLFSYLSIVLQQSAVGVDVAAIKAAVIRAYTNP